MGLEIHIVGDLSACALKRLLAEQITSFHWVMPPTQSSSPVENFDERVWATGNPFLFNDERAYVASVPKSWQNRCSFFCLMDSGRNVDWSRGRYKIESWDADETQFVEDVANVAGSSDYISFLYVSSSPPLEARVKESEANPSWGGLEAEDIGRVLRSPNQALGAPWAKSDFYWLRSFHYPVDSIAIACFDSTLGIERQRLLEIWGSLLPTVDVDECLELISEARKAR